MSFAVIRVQERATVSRSDCGNRTHHGEFEFGSDSVVKLLGFVRFGSESPQNVVRIRRVRFRFGSIPVSSISTLGKSFTPVCLYADSSGPICTTCAFVALANLRYINALNSNNNTYTEPSPSQTDLRTAVVVVDRRNFCAERHYQTCTDCANKTSPSVVPGTTDHCTLYIRGPLYILCCEFSRRKLSPTLASAHYSCPDNAIALVMGADFHRAVVATAPGEKLLIGRSPMRNWTQLHIFLCFTGSQ